MGDGTADKLKGHAKEAAGEVTDDDSLKREGRPRQRRRQGQGRRRERQAQGRRSEGLIRARERRLVRALPDQAGVRRAANGRGV